MRKYNLITAKLLIILGLCLTNILFALPKAAKPRNAEEAEQIKKEKEEKLKIEYENARSEKLQKHFEKQSAEARKRMKENKKKTDKFYKSKLKQGFFARLFASKRKIPARPKPRR